MQANKTVTINGRLYDAVTGLPIEKKVAVRPTTPSKPAATKRAEAKRAATTPATAVHSAPQRSQTLHRRSIKKPGVAAKRPQPGRHMDIARSSKVARFAPHPVAKPTPKSTPDIAASTHPTVARAVARTAAPVAKAPVTSKQIKDEAITKALAAPRIKMPKAKRFTISRRFTIVTAIFAVLILGAYLTYVNIPSLSVSFAASQAGVNATYPEYRPDGFRLDQPVTYSEGVVTLKFASNSGAGDFTIVQRNSSWDSSAVLDNIVKKAAGDNYITTQERGLTIYSYQNSAVWVNGSILYTITSTAPLSGEQIRRIATSL